MRDRDTTLSALGALLERHRGDTSKREVSRRAGISEGRWRQIVTGQQKAGGGIVVPVNPRRDTVIAMARAVGADVTEALTLAGFEPTAADVIDPTTADHVEAAILSDPTMTDRDKRIMVELRRSMRAENATARSDVQPGRSRRKAQP